MQTRILPLLLALAGCPAGAAALSTDREQPVRIDADAASLDDRNRTASYRGNVVLVQGSLRITGDVVTMHFDENFDLARLVAEGAPARFEQRLDAGPVQKGQAARIDYRVEEGSMLFAGSAEITQGELGMKAARIDYDLATGAIRGGAGEETGGKRRRVTIILGDRKK